MTDRDESFYEAVYRVTRMIPRGRVASYGQIAAILGSPRASRAVGYALFNLRTDAAHADVPWQRVVNAQGGISARGDAVRAELQRRLLEQEGVRFEGEIVKLEAWRWEGPSLFGMGEIRFREE